MKKYILTVLVLVICSCNIPYINADYSSSHKDTFKYYFNELEEHFVYWDIKGESGTELSTQTLWDFYNPLVNNNLSDEDFFDLLADFTNELKDGHSNIISPFARQSYYDQLIEEAIGFNSNFDWVTIKHAYLTDQYVYGVTTQHGIINRDGNKYGYIYYSSFMDMIEEDLKYSLKRFRDEDVSGIILDIRNNGGGALLNMSTIVSYLGAAFSGSSRDVVKVWRRDGKNSYSRVNAINTLFYDESFHVETKKEVYKGPVALLTNRGSYSASSFTATAFKIFDNVKQIGTSTGGGMGLPVGGYLPNGWSYRFSSNKCLDARATSHNDVQYNYENGVPADIEITIDTDFEGVDEIIEGALTWIDSDHGFIDTYSR